MNRTRLVLFTIAIILSLSLGVTAWLASPAEARPHVVVNFFVVGEEPFPMGADFYRTKWRWAPKLLAVYLDGKRCREHIDYTVYPKSKQISFHHDTAGKPVIVDYHPRPR